MKFLLGMVLILMSWLGAGQDLGLAPKGNGNQIIGRAEYLLSYNEEHEQPDWVYYVLTKSEVYSKCDRTNDFREDPEVKTGSATLEDYKYSGYDRGHLSPAADNKGNCPTSMSESFYMSNVSPMKPDFNRGIWGKLEYLVRGFAIKYNEIYVVTGPVLIDSLIIERIGPNQVSVPKYFYKVILDFKREQGIGFIMENEGAEGDLFKWAVSIDSVEVFTGLDFFSGLEDRIEEMIEGACIIENWNK